jgi:hypothetical protein
MIRSFRHKGLEQFFATGTTRGINAQQAAKLRRLLTTLHMAVGQKTSISRAIGFIRSMGNARDSGRSGCRGIGWCPSSTVPMLSMLIWSIITDERRAYGDV